MAPTAVHTPFATQERTVTLSTANSPGTVLPIVTGTNVIYSPSGSRPFVNTKSVPPSESPALANTELVPYSLVVAANSTTVRIQNSSTFVTVDEDAKVELILSFLAAKRKATKNGRLPRGSLNLAATEFRVPVSQVKNVLAKHLRRTGKNKNESTVVGDNLSEMNQDELWSQICIFLSRQCTPGGRLCRGAAHKAAKAFGRSERSVRHLWYQHSSSILAAEKLKFSCCRKSGSGRPFKLTIE